MQLYEFAIDKNASCALTTRPASDLGGGKGSGPRAPHHREPLTMFMCLAICATRAVSAAPHTFQLGGNAVTGGPKFQSRHHLAPQRKLRSPKLKYEALEINEFMGHFETKVHYSFFGPL